MSKGKRVDKKEISAGTTVKAVITGYMAYGILLGFIAFVVTIVVNWSIAQIPNIDHRALSITLPVLGVCLLYFIVHGVCKLSIYDVFRKCKTNPSRMEKICTRLNLFVLICVSVSVIAIIFNLVLNFNNERKAIEIASSKYSSVFSEQFSEKLTKDMLNNFQEEKTNTMISTIILELGMVFSYLSIIPYQKNLIEKYNEF